VDLGEMRKGRERAGEAQREEEEGEGRGVVKAGLG